MSIIDLQNHPKSFEQLTSEEQRELVNWIKTNFDTIKSINERHTSYSLKHIFENNGGFYVGNGAFKGAMLQCGYEVKDESALNWKFNVSEKSIKAIQKL